MNVVYECVFHYRYVTFRFRDTLIPFDTPEEPWLDQPTQPLRHASDQKHAEDHQGH